MSNASDNTYPEFHFTSPSMSKSATDEGTFRTIHGLSRPRVARVRKSKHNRTVGGASVSLKLDTSLDRLQPASDDSGRVWTKSCNLESRNRNEGSDFVASGTADTITDKMKNLDVKAGTEGNVIFGLDDSMILDQLGKLKIRDQQKGSDYSSQTSAPPEGMVDKFTPEVGNIHGEGSVAAEVQVPRCQESDEIQSKHQLQYTSKQDDLRTPELNTPSPKGTLFTGVGEGIGNVSSCCINERAVDSSSEVSLSAFETENLKSEKGLSKTSEGNKEVSSRRNDQAQSGGDCKTQFFSVSSSESGEGAPFEFSASSPVDYQAAAIRSQKKKNSKKVCQDPYNYFKNTPLSNAPSTMHFSEHNCKERPSLGVEQRRHVKQGITSPPAIVSAAKKDCEKWRLRGNQAYSNGDLDKAEAYYTQGVNCISKSEASRDELRSLMLCYSDRAAIRMSLKRFRDALVDCAAASEIDPNFFRVLVRKANCYLALGEVAEASPLLMKLLQLGTEVCVDRKLIVEASDSFQKAQKVSQCISHCTELLGQNTWKEAEVSLEAIETALSISPYSEKLLQMKTEALFMMHMYREVIQLCEQTLQTAEKNFPLLGLNDNSSNLNPCEFLDNQCFWIWRYSFIFNSYFYLGKLEEGIDFLEKQPYLKSAIDRFGPQFVESLIPLVIPARVQVKHKCAGNEAYQAGKHAEAVEHYTIALACNAQSRPFAAVCFGNRAAANQALGQITDAIADCNMAIALDPNYVKAISRRATLFETIRDYGEAASDLQKVTYFMTKQAEEKGNQEKETDSLNSSQADLKQAHMRLAQLEEQAIKEPPLDFYLILGVEPSATSADLKKAYRKAALKHHPDKACQLLTRSENIDDGVWKEMSEEVQREADRLFKIIGEAYSVISDPTKRSLYEEEVRNVMKKQSGIGGSRMRSDHSYGYPRSPSSARTRKESWTSPGNSRGRHFETSRSNRFY